MESPNTIIYVALFLKYLLSPCVEEVASKKMFVRRPVIRHMYGFQNSHSVIRHNNRPKRIELSKKPDCYLVFGAFLVDQVASKVD